MEGSRARLISQMRHGIHVEEFATVLSGRRSSPSAVALLESHITGIYKPHTESLQQFLSSGADIDTSFEIKLRDVVDIKVRKDFMAHREKIRAKECPEVVYIFHGSSEANVSCCTVYTSTMRFSKVLLSLWHARIVKRALNVKMTRPSGMDDPITREYYTESVLSLKSAESRADLISVLSEFAKECQSDTSLKLLAFETLDIFIVLQSICRGALFLAEAGPHRSFDRPDLLWASCLDVVVDRGPEDARALQLSRDKAERELLQRFRLYQAALNVLVSLLFGSDVVHLKHRLIAGPSPLTVADWLPILACDVNMVLSNLLGFEATAKGLEETGALALEEEILRSVQPPGSLSSSTQMGLGTDAFLRTEFLRTSTDSVRSSQTRQSLSLHAGGLSGSSGFGLQRRVQRQLVFSHTSSDELIAVRQVTMDLQSLMLTFMGEMTVFGANTHTRPSNQIEFGGPRVAATAVDSVGECLVRVPEWGFFLEQLVVRCGVIIDDFMNAESVASELRQLHRARDGYIRKKAAASAAAGSRGTIRERLKRSSAAEEAAGEADQAGPAASGSAVVNNSSVGDSITTRTGHSVRFDSSVEVQQQEDRGKVIGRSGFLPVPMSPKKTKRSFVKEAVAAKEQSGRFWGRRGHSAGKSTPEDAPVGKTADFVEEEPSALRSGPLLETQEVLIFYFTHLICFLAGDCAQLRKYFESDLKDYIVAIVCCLRYLCPLKGQYHSVVVASARATAGALEAEKKAAEAAKQIQSDVKLSTESTEKENKGAKEAILKAKAQTAAAVAEKKGGDKKTADKRMKEEELRAWLNAPLELTTDHRSQKRMHSSIAEFEEARFGLSEGAWALMLLSSLQLEQTFDAILDDVPLDVDDMFGDF